LPPAPKRAESLFGPSAAALKLRRANRQNRFTQNLTEQILDIYALIAYPDFVISKSGLRKT